MVLLSSLRLIWSGVDAIDSPDQSRQGFEHMLHLKFLKNFSGDFSMACRQKFLIFGIFKACISKTAYKSFENTKKKEFFDDKPSKRRLKNFFKDFECIILFKTLTGLIRAINRTNF